MYKLRAPTDIDIVEIIVPSTTPQIIPEVNKKIIAIGISITIPNINKKQNTIIDNDEFTKEKLYINSKL